MTRFIALAFGAAVLGGCAGSQTDGMQATDAAYKDGYRVGCYEGYSAAGWKGYETRNANAQRLAADGRYRIGREDGMQHCYQEAIERPAGRDVGGGG